LLPATEGTQGLADWDEVAALPDLATLATDPYWKHWNEAAGPFVRRFARLLRETADRRRIGAQLWLPSFGLDQGDIPELEAAVAAAREEGVEDLWTWGYEACRHMTALATPAASLVWDAVSTALTGRPQTAATETAQADLGDLDLRSTRDLVRLLNEEDATVPAAVAEAGEALAAAIDAIVERMRRGGRLIYAGAGTSGALAALDASECGSTFGSPPGEVLAVVAEQDADEDDRAAATDALRGLSLRPEDCVVAVSASGSTPFVLAALEAARERGALGVAVASARESRAAALADHEVAVVVGPEVIAGSTRLKAGTAQKLVLNTISTVTMIRLGRTYGGLMVGVSPTNEKLRERARRNVVLASGASEEQVDEALRAAAGDARVALVSLLTGVDADAARVRLEASEGSVRKASGR
jgi:N-acetylmuramic acid 6-phosphate etherase